MNKTVTVRIHSYHFNYKVGIWMTKGRNFHCHDEEEYCRTGDKVIISQCRKLSKSKNFFIRNIVLAAGRQNFYTKDMSTYEKDAIKFNEELR
jgi:small subunit ribosomal protein S17